MKYQYILYILLLHQITNFAQGNDFGGYFLFQRAESDWWVIIIGFAFIAFIIFLVNRIIIKQAGYRTQKLEKLVYERTLEIGLKTEEITVQKEILNEANEQLKERQLDIEKQAKLLKEQRDEISNQNDKLLEMDKFKQGMTSMIVHDLKNPLNLILNVPNTLDTAKKDKVIQQSGKQMLNMVLNILDIDKYEERNMVLNLEEKQFVLIAINAVEQVQFLSGQKEIAINNQIDRLLFTKVEEEIAERIMVNLLTNAIKYTPLNGSITLTSHPISETFVRIEVQDTGEGIPEDKIHLVFQKFGQIIAKKSGGVRSTGLGLTFCKLAVEAHGGEIGLNSEEGKGTTFWFTLKIGTCNNAIIEIVEKEIVVEDEVLLFTEEEKQTLEPIIDQLKAFTIYETGDVEDIINQLIPSASENIQKWIAEIEKNLVTLNQARFLELIKIM